MKKNRKKRKWLKIAVIALAVVFGSVLLQFAYNMLFVKPYEPVLTKGGDGKLTKMLYESPLLPDEYFENTASY